MEKAAEFKALQEQDPQDIKLVIEAERMADLRRGELEAMQKQLQDLLEQRDQARYDDEEWRQGLEALAAQAAAEDEEQLRLQREAIASETAPPSPSENDRLITQMEERFALERKQREAETAENRGQLDRIENLLGSVMQQLSATKEENQQLKAQLAEQDSPFSSTTKALTGETKEASATVQVSFGVSAKAEVGKAKVVQPKRAKGDYDHQSNAVYWKGQEKDRVVRVDLRKCNWKPKQAIMIRSGIDVYDTDVLQVRLASFFRNNAWKCELLNAGKGDTAILALGHSRYQPEPPSSDYNFIFTCLDDEDAFDRVQSEVMLELFNADKNTQLQKHECLEVHKEVLRRMNRAA